MNSNWGGDNVIDKLRYSLPYKNESISTGVVLNTAESSIDSSVFVGVRDKPRAV